MICCRRAYGRKTQVLEHIRNTVDNTRGSVSHESIASSSRVPKRNVYNRCLCLHAKDSFSSSLTRLPEQGVANSSYLHSSDMLPLCSNLEHAPIDCVHVLNPFFYAWHFPFLRPVDRCWENLLQSACPYKYQQRRSCRVAQNAIILSGVHEEPVFHNNRFK